MCSTATRMNRNELPQMTDVAAKSSAAFRFTFPPPLTAGRRNVLYPSNQACTEVSDATTPRWPWLTRQLDPQPRYFSAASVRDRWPGARNGEPGQARAAWHPDLPVLALTGWLPDAVTALLLSGGPRSARSVRPADWLRPDRCAFGLIHQLHQSLLLQARADWPPLF